MRRGSALRGLVSPLTERSLLSTVLSVLAVLSSIISRHRFDEARWPILGFSGMLGTGRTVSELLDLPEDLLEGLLTIARGLAG